LVTNAGSNSKFLGVLDFDVRGGKVQDFRYKLLPVFANLLPADQEMQAHIDKVRAPYKAKLEEKLAVTEDLLYRRGNFNGSWDQVICDALIEVKGADMSFSPGVRWGTSLLPGDVITYERMMDQMALTYPATTLNEFTGAEIKTILEDIGDNIFNPDPYYQQGGDMVRVGGLQYSVTPNAPMGQRINNMVLKGKPVDADKKYKVAGWASVQEGVQGEPIWDVVSGYLRDKKVIKGVKINTPEIVGMKGNPGIAG
ncbi:MAG: 5'-nucleotidase C-terminal domain-containing protein, partial [Hydrogenophaga sp.]|nr:5'-nucleotidase C-terminal domain-containing protein [Hydrogenophaga sp.]